MGNAVMRILASGSKRDNTILERWLVERFTDPLNFEPWAGKFARFIPAMIEEGETGGRRVRLTSMSNKPLPAMTVLTVLGGTTDAEWQRALRSLTKRVGAVADRYRPSFHVSVVFDVPGDVRAPGFVGIRIRNIGRDDSLTWLRVVVGLAEHPMEDADRELQDILKRVVVEAEEYGRRRGIAENLNELHEMLEAL